jgi:hypothetical protein
MAAAWQQFAMAIVVDLLNTGCFIAHEVMGWEARAARRQTAGDAREPFTQKDDAPAMRNRRGV